MALITTKAATATTATSVPVSALPSGTVVQTAYQDGWTYQGSEGMWLNNTTGKVIECVLTLKTTNPIILVRYCLPVGMNNTYEDHDLALGFGIRNAAASNTVGDYNNFGGIGRSRHSIAFGDGNKTHYTVDTQGAGVSGQQYWMEIVSHEYKAAVTMNAGTYCAVALWANSDAEYGFFRPYSHYTGDSGAQGSYVVQEIKA